MTARVVINADDLGLAEGVNSGIFEAMDAGAVTDVSLIVNGEAFASAVEGLRARGVGAVGVHCCLVDDERPLIDAAQAGPLLDGEHFHINRNRLFARCLLDRRRTLEAIRAELAAQVQRVRATGLLVSHLDSHQHTHLFPGIAEIVVSVARREGIPFVRVPCTRRGTPVAWAVEALGWRLRRLASRAGLVAYPSLGLEVSGRTTEQSLRHDFTRARRFPLAEVIVHPGRWDERMGIKYAHWGYDWDRELAVVLRARAIAEEIGVVPVSFHELHQAGVM